MSTETNTPSRPSPLDALTELQIVHRLSLKALTDLTIDEMAALALEESMALITPDFVFLYGLAEGCLVLQGVRPPGLALPPQREIGECLCGLAAKNRQPIYSLDIHGDGRCTLHECKEAGVRSFVALPLLVGSELLGVLGLAATREWDFGQQGAILEALATTIALALKKVKHCHELRERTLDLESRVADCTTDLAIRTSELERLNRIFVDREFRIKGLKERVKVLEGR